MITINLSHSIILCSTSSAGMIILCIILCCSRLGSLVLWIYGIAGLCDVNFVPDWPTSIVSYKTSDIGQRYR